MALRLNTYKSISLSRQDNLGTVLRYSDQRSVCSRHDSYKTACLQKKLLCTSERKEGEERKKEKKED